jgi:hypothetical protein
MSISYQSKDDAVLGLQLKVQELCVKMSDVAVLSVGSGTDVTIDVKEPVGEVRAALHCDDDVGVYLIAQAGISYPDSKDQSGAPTPSIPGGSKITITLSNAIAAEDSVIVKYVIAE